MKTETMTLADFLLARITEDENAARAAVIHRGQVVTKANVRGVWLNSRYHMTVDPARVLAECEAKRRIVERCQVMPEPLSPGYNDCDMIQMALAMPYADHPDYSPEWRVDG